MSIVLTVGIVISLFLFILLLNKRNKSLPDKLLALGVCTIGIHLLSYNLYYLGYWEIYPHLIGITVPFPLLYGPVIFLYTKYSLRASSALNKEDYLHFLPAVLSCLYMLRFYFFYSAEEKLQVISGAVDDFGTFTSILLVGYAISGLTYTVLAYLKTIAHKRVVDNNFSYDNQISLDWLKYSIVWNGTIFLIVAIILALREGLGVQFSFNADLIFYVLIVVHICWIGFFGIQHENIFSNLRTPEQQNLIAAPRPGEYKNSGLKPEAAALIHKELLELMVSEKPYLEPKLTLADLAEMMDVSVNHLSQTINQFEKANFHDFVNRYRIDEFIARAKMNTNFSILANALDSGFNSKSSFNTVFKKFMKTTPSHYLSSLKN